MKFNIITLGCKVNAYESEYMQEAMLKAGYTLDQAHPDIVIINTCSVTNMADKKSRQFVRRERRENPAAILVVVGCSTQNLQTAYDDMGIDILLGNKEKSQIVSLIEDYQKKHEHYTYFACDRNLAFEDMEVQEFTTHTRAFIKIQDGCDNFCSFCIIPYVRGSIRSKDFSKAVEEVQSLVANGHKEIVLTGIHTGSYYDNGKNLSDFIQEIAKIKALKRIRISSIEITELNDKFLELLKKEPKIANHLHIPLQSGSDTVLKRMNRKYDTAYFREKIKDIRAIRPDISITTDCIVGHPYEDEDCFLEYKEFCREISFSKLHVFPYSKRDGTPSALMPQVDDKVKRRRTKDLIALSEQLEDEYNHKFIGQTLEVLTEEYSDNFTVGFTSNYIKVYIEGQLELNEIYECKLTKITDKKNYGVILSCLKDEIKI